eukprot:CAMPEP_0183394064 /NCGR_PEP_ID=MMETSP0370-20130417/8308_1 /TAXON_ID=268820 /ORGANISM="Peridinium aciculiferum, Strain PAER-2" /LENGTH=61 /DNA_ID=CAMNT_0025574369 /DNA_START=54 /DNA_END=236 /DNA_ORIENTATION=-
MRRLPMYPPSGAELPPPAKSEKRGEVQRSLARLHSIFVGRRCTECRASLGAKQWVPMEPCC